MQGRCCIDYPVGMQSCVRHPENDKLMLCHAVQDVCALVRHLVCQLILHGGLDALGQCPVCSVH